LLIAEALSKFRAEICKLPFQDRSQLIVSVFIAVTVLASMAIIARLFSRATKGNRLGLEDWIIAAALVGIFGGSYILADDCRYSLFQP
jgi:hypothetical protein